MIWFSSFHHTMTTGNIACALYDLKKDGCLDEVTIIKDHDGSYTNAIVVDAYGKQFKVLVEEIND